jgi:hypothetical protein
VKIASRPRVPGGAPEPGWTIAEHERAVTEYWAAVRRHRGSDYRVHRPLTTNQHILHLLLTIVTAGVWAPFWFFLAWQSTHVRTEANPAEPMPAWPPARPPTAS